MDSTESLLYVSMLKAQIAQFTGHGECEHESCAKQGLPCCIPKLRRPVASFCETHRAGYGFCEKCGIYAGDDEDFGYTRLCFVCMSEEEEN